MAQQVIKTQKPREGKKNNHVWTCLGDRYSGGSPLVSAAERLTDRRAFRSLPGPRASNSPSTTHPRLPRARAAHRPQAETLAAGIPIPVQAPTAAIPLFPF